MRKKILLIVMVMMNCVGVFGQVPGWEWAKSAGGNSGDAANCITVAASGNSYVVGGFSSNTISFGNVTLTNTSANFIYGDIFIVKYDVAGNVVWAKSVGGSNSDGARGISVDADENVYVTGSFQSDTINFDTITLINFGGTAINPIDIFIAKYDSSGNVIWAKSAGGDNSDGTNSIATDANGNSYITGSFWSSAITFGNSILSNPSGGSTFFIVKYDSSGNVAWAKRAIANGPNHGKSLALDIAGNSYITGGFWCPSISFDSITVTNLTSNHNAIFTVKYDSSGNTIWAKSASGNNHDYSESIATDAFGNAYVTGEFRSSSITFGSTTLLNAGLDDAFIVKYDAVGNVLWANKIGGSYTERGKGITVDANQNFYLTGLFDSPTITFGSTTLTNMDWQDIFIVKYNSSINVLWAKSIGGDDIENVSQISLDINDNLYLTGSFISDTLIFNNTILINAGGGSLDALVAKLGSVTGLAEEINSSNLITLFPNPTTSQISITSSFIIDKVEITDVMGRVVYEAMPKQKDFRVEMDHKEGIYFITLSTDKQSVVRKVVVQR